MKASKGTKSSRGAVFSLSLSHTSNSPQQLAHKHQLSCLLVAAGKVSDSDLTKLLTVIYTRCPWYPQESSPVKSVSLGANSSLVRNGVGIVNVQQLNTWNLCCIVVSAIEEQETPWADLIPPPEAPPPSPPITSKPILV